MSLGLMSTIKPLIQCFGMFTKLKDLRITNVNLGKLHFMAIDNYLIANPNLLKLSLTNVHMGHDQFMILAGTIRNSKKLLKLNICSNYIKD